MADLQCCVFRYKVIQLYIYIYSFFFRFFSLTGYHRILSRVSSLGYMGGPCWLPILHIVVYICSLKPPDFALPTTAMFSLW